MITFLEHNGKLMSFNDFCLSEAITHTKTEFGVNKDMNDGGYHHIQGYAGAFFKHEHKNGTTYHSVLMDRETGEVGFGTSDRHSLIPSAYTHDKKDSTGDAFGTFGKSMHVLQHLADKHNMKKIISAITIAATLAVSTPAIAGGRGYDYRWGVDHGGRQHSGTYRGHRRDR